MKYTLTFKLAWWNCGLLHVKPEQQAACFQDAAEVVKRLQAQNCDIIALCEIPLDGEALLEQLFSCPRYRIYFCTRLIGRSRLDFCLLLNTQSAALVRGLEVLSGAWLGNALKIGCRADVLLRDKTPLCLILSHFPSRLHHTRAEKARAIIHHLRQLLNQCTGHTVLMGDFNAEPYDEDLSNGLYATRDWALAAQKPYMLYNPFWAQMHARRCHPCAGTYYYRQGIISRWYTFDQMMFSASLLNESGWHVRHTKNKLFATPDLLGKIRSSKHKFDHIPIICELERLVNTHDFYRIPK